MRTVLREGGRFAGILLAGLLATAVQAADAKPAAAPAGPDVHKMVILNGNTYTTHYFSVGLSANDQASLRDLERAENDVAYADNLLALRSQYVADEMAFEPIRASVQRGLYGKSITSNYSPYLLGAGYGLGLYGPGYSGYCGYPLSGYGYYGGGYRDAYDSFFIGTSAATVNQSLAYGVGDEGVIKSTLAAGLATQATSDYAASAARAYTAALNRAGESEAIRTALNLTPSGGAEPARHVTLTLKSGDKVEGNVSDEDSDWITVDTATDQVSVRKADVSRIDRHKK